MVFPERFSNLPEYAFPRLRTLIDVHKPGGDPISMTIGEPQHDFPTWVSEIISEHAQEFKKYPVNDGTPELRGAISDWIKRRYGVSVDPATQIMALNGTREGLYNAAMALCPETKNGARPVILTPNPFYQVYAVAGLSVDADVEFVAADETSKHLPNYGALPQDILDRVAIAYVCSPSNPQGAVADRAYWTALFELAAKHNFKIFADECYSEIYRARAPLGAIEVAREVGFPIENLCIFHSLSKRSNVPGLRSGFVAGGPKCIGEIKKLRNYAGAPLPLPLQRAAEKLWADEAHVEENRRLYREKYDIADEIFKDVAGYESPQAGFFLWLPVEDGEKAALKLWTGTGVRVLPGAYLSREMNGINPGRRYIRVALVAPKKETQQGLKRIHDCLYG